MLHQTEPAICSPVLHKKKHIDRKDKNNPLTPIFKGNAEILFFFFNP